MTSRGRRCQELGWLTQLSWRKCARTGVRGESAGNGMLSAAAHLNRLLTMHTANSAHLSGAAPHGTRGRAPMSINDLPGLAALRTRMQWHQERQRVLSENVANSDTPNFRPRDLVEPKFDPTGAAAAGSMGPLAMVQTSTGHIAPLESEPTFDQDRKTGFETR